MNKDIINYINSIDINDLNFKYNEFDVVFSGGGLKGYYLVGIYKILKHYEELNKIKIRYIIGASIGAISAVIFACSLNVNILFELYYNIKKNINNADLHTIAINYIKNILPSNAYIICNGKVKIFLSKLTIFGLYEEIIDTFNSNEHLINVLSASINIPYYTSSNCYGTRINNIIYYDSFITRKIPLIYNNDLPQLVIKTYNTNYSNTLALKPVDSFIELLSLRGLYESKNFFKHNKDHKSLIWFDKNISVPTRKQYLYIIVPIIFYTFNMVF